MAKLTLAEIRRNMPNATFEEVPHGSLPGNHVGFGITADGIAYVHYTVSPSERYGIDKPQSVVRYESSICAS